MFNEILYYVLLFCIASNLGCWTQINDVHGFGGVPHSIQTVGECQTACVNNVRCVAIDWDPTNAGKSCWIQTLTDIGSTTEAGTIIHYQLHRLYISESHFATHCLLLDCIALLT